MASLDENSVTSHCADHLSRHLSIRNTLEEACYEYQDLDHVCHFRGFAWQRVLEQELCWRRNNSLARSRQEYRSGPRNGLYVLGHTP
jgi:hypothetical protein